MELSLRLRTIADLVPEGVRLADIGTDHGYIPITLLKEGRIPSAIAMDIGKGPLERAREHAVENSMTDRMELRLSDGFHALKAGEADAAVIAGMGGLLMVKILEEGREQVQSLKTLILSPQSDLESFRTYVLNHDLSIEEEVMVLDEEKYYVIMRVVPSESPEMWNIEELRYGRHLIEEGSPVFLSFLEKELAQLQKIRETLSGAASEKAKERLKLVDEEAALLEKTIEKTIKKAGE